MPTNGLADRWRNFAASEYFESGIGLMRLAIAYGWGRWDKRQRLKPAEAKLLSEAKPKPATIFAIHNLAFQENFHHDVVRAIGIPEGSFNTEGAEFYGQASYLKAADKAGQSGIRSQIDRFWR